MSVKLQITLPDGLAAALKAAGTRQGVSMAQLLREGAELRLELLKARRGRDPFASITGLVDSEETDLSSRIDEILYR